MSREKWPGGYVHRQADGRPLFIIEREVRGRRFHVSTRAHNLRAAMKQLERFEGDPAGYQPEGVTVDALLMTDDLIKEHRAHSIDVRNNTEAHANNVFRFLCDWQEDLRGLDLRAVNLRDHVKPALERRRTSRPGRIIALKSFYAWLRKEKHLLTSAGDPTLDLPVPQVAPEKHRRRKAVEFERVAAVFRHLAPVYRDVLQLLAATGWHVSEVERFVRRDESAVVKPDREVRDRLGRTVLAVLVTWHKTKKHTRTPLVEPEHVAAAERLRERRRMPRLLRATIHGACDAAGVARFNPGSLRHSVGTWAIELGATKEQVAEYLDHADSRTTDRFYIDVAIPTTTVPVRVLS